jgi:TolB protein
MIPLLCRWLAACLLSFLPLQLAYAQLSIEIVGGAAQAIPIAIVPFEAEATWPIGITGIVSADLTRSGLFRMVDTNGVVPRPSKAQDVQPAVWRARNADAVLVGSMLPLPDGRADVRFALVDVV